MSEPTDLDTVLHECGIDYPTGLRGVRDLYRLFLGQKDRAEEAEAAVTDLRARVEAVAEAMDEQPTKGNDGLVLGRFAARLRAAVTDTAGDPA